MVFVKGDIIIVFFFFFFVHNSGYGDRDWSR